MGKHIVSDTKVGRHNVGYPDVSDIFLVTVCTDDDVAVEQQANSKRFMRFGRAQHDDVSRMVEHLLPAKREFMRFGRDVRRQCRPGDADCFVGKQLMSDM